jgi:hypothetical protein
LLKHRITKTLKTIIHLNLVIALGLADLIFLFGNLAESSKVGASGLYHAVFTLDSFFTS